MAAAGVLPAALAACHLAAVQLHGRRQGYGCAWLMSCVCFQQQQRDLLACLCSDGIVRWVKKKTGPAAATIEDKAGLEAAEKESEVLVLGYFKELKVGVTRGGSDRWGMRPPGACAWCGVARCAVLRPLGVHPAPRWLLWRRSSSPRCWPSGCPMVLPAGR